MFAMFRELVMGVEVAIKVLLFGPIIRTRNHRKDSLIQEFAEEREPKFSLIRTRLFIAAIGRIFVIDVPVQEAIHVVALEEHVIVLGGIVQD